MTNNNYNPPLIYQANKHLFKRGDVHERLGINMTNGSELLKIQDLYACIDDTSILKGINLEIKPGEIHAIMGRNGSGKTTTANIIMGHPDYEVESGTVELNGKDLLEMET